MTPKAMPGARLATSSLVFLVRVSNAVPRPRAQQPIFRAGVTMVPIDVRAVDRNGKPVTDLTPSDFTIVEDGVPEQIAHFSTQAFTAEAGAPTRALVSTRSGGTSTSPLAGVPPIAPQTARVYLIVLGRGRLQVPNQGIDGVLHFVRNRLLPQDRVAILAYNRATDRMVADDLTAIDLSSRFQYLWAGRRHQGPRPRHDVLGCARRT